MLHTAFSLTARPAGERCSPRDVEGDGDALALLVGTGPEGAVPPTLALHGKSYRVICVDGRSPRQQTRPGASRARHLYHRDELAHFQLGEHRYVLVPEVEPMLAAIGEPPGPSAAELPLEAPAQREWRQLLTNRELQIVQLICLGLVTRQVALRLHLSEFTVRSYLKTIYCKLGVRSRGAMVFAYASAFGVALPAAVDEDDAPTPAAAQSGWRGAGPV